jgi:hypothetical protein
MFKGINRGRIASLAIVTLVISLIPNLVMVSPSSATVSTTVASVYVDAPFVQGSYARHHGGVTETFNNLTSSDAGVSVTSNTHSIVGGTKTSGQFTVYNNNSTFGANGITETASVNVAGTKFANTDATGFEITFSTAVKYIGFYWAAGNAGNSVELWSGSTRIATITTNDLSTLLGGFPSNYAASTDSITATNGARYLKKYYFGPAAGYATETPTSQSTISFVNEPYAYVHSFARNDESFDKLKFFGSGFEFDNLTVSSQEVPIRTSLVLVNDVTTNLTLGESNWNFKGVTTTDSSTVSTGWVSDSSTVVRSTGISIEQDLSISSGTITMGRTALFRTSITDAGNNTCGTTFTLVDSYTATDTGYIDITLAPDGTASRNRLVRGFCYKWTLDPSSSLGTGAVRPTSSASGTRFNSNLESPMIIIPEILVTSCTGAGSLTNGSFEDGNTGFSGGYLSSTSAAPGWRTTATDGQKEVWGARSASPSGTAQISQPSNFYGYSGSYIAEITAGAGGDQQGLYQDVSTITGSRIFWSYWHHHRAGGANNNDQVARFRAGPVASNRPAAANGTWTQNEQDTPFDGVTVIADQTHTATVNGGWTQSRGTFEASSSTTRFLFNNQTVPQSGYGNLIDDVRFTTFTACPMSLTITAGTASDIVIRNVEQDTSTTQVLGTTFRYYAPQAATIASLSSISQGLSASVSSVANTSSTFSLSANQAGRFTFNYRVTYEQDSQTYSSVASVTVNVLEAGSVTSCAGAGSLVNGNFETLPFPDSITVQSANANGPPNPAEGTWHGYGSNANPKQYLFLLGSDNTSSSIFKLNGWRTTASDGLIEIQRVSGAARTNGNLSGQADYQSPDSVGVRPASGSFHAELAANQLSALFQDIGSIPGTTIRWSVKHRARIPGATDRMEVRIGSTTSQTAQTVTQWRAPNNDVYQTPTYSDALTETSTTTIATSLGQGWVEYRGSYVVPTGQTTTRFRFEATAGSGSQGNLLDDIQFSPLIACPANLTVVAGRQVTIRPFDIDSSGNPLGNDSIDSYGWNDAFVTETLTATSGTVGRTTVGGVVNRGITYTAPSTVGEETISFQIRNPQGDTSRSNYTINVVADSRTRAPGEIPMDPRTTVYNFRNPTVTTATTRVLACVRQANSSGAIISGSLRFDVGTRGTSQTTITFGSESVTVSNDISNTLNITGPITAVNRALAGLWVTRNDTPARLSSRFYIHVSSMVTGLVLYSPTDCNNAITNQIRVTTLRPITLTQTRRFTTTLKNGRQQS